MPGERRILFYLAVGIPLGTAIYLIGRALGWN